MSAVGTVLAHGSQRLQGGCSSPPTSQQGGRELKIREGTRPKKPNSRTTRRKAEPTCFFLVLLGDFIGIFGRFHRQTRLFCGWKRIYFGHIFGDLAAKRLCFRYRPANAFIRAFRSQRQRRNFDFFRGALSSFPHSIFVKRGQPLKDRACRFAEFQPCTYDSLVSEYSKMAW